MDVQLEMLTTYIESRDISNPKVSKANVAWHIDHSLKTINRICEVLISSNPKEFKTNFSISRILIYARGDFPRGIAKAPKKVRPPEEILTENLYSQLDEARKNLKKIALLDKNAHFVHPYFKTINRNQSKKFLLIHTKHHLKIIRDILNK